MVFKGSVSYKSDKINYVRLNATTEVKIERMDHNVAMITFVTANDQQVNIPPNVDLIYMDNNASAPRVGQAYIIAWVDNYRLVVGGVELFRLENQKQQSIGGSADLQTRYIEA